MTKKKCPCCKTIGFEETMYAPAEGGWCEQCHIWIVPISSLKEIIEARSESDNLKIMFHKKGERLFTWEDLQEMSAFNYIDFSSNNRIPSTELFRENIQLKEKLDLVKKYYLRQKEEHLNLTGLEKILGAKN